MYIDDSVFEEETKALKEAPEKKEKSVDKGFRVKIKIIIREIRELIGLDPV